MTKRAKRIWAVVGAVFIAVAIYSWFFGTAILLVWQVRQFARENPALNTVPVPLSDSDISQAVGDTVSAGDYEFELPWRSVKEERTQKVPNWKAFISQDGSTVAVFFPVNQIQSQSEAYRSMRVRYDFAREVLESTPEQLTIFASPKEIRTRSFRLLMKPLLLPTSEISRIYTIKTPAFSGFQYGDPESHPKYIHADLFSQDCFFKFVFSNRSGGRTISQPEINRVIQTVRKRIAPIEQGSSRKP